MRNHELLSISELAAFARVSRTALIHYDKIGLISPVKRGENNYRYYSYGQVALVNMIRTYQELGLSLKEIARISRIRTPESIMKIMRDRIHRIDHDIAALAKTQKLLLTLKDTIEDALGADEHSVQIRRMDAESILLGPPNDYSNGRHMSDALLDFYTHFSRAEDPVDLNYSVWGIYSEDRLRRHDWVWPDRFYFRMPDAPDTKPAGLYAIGYTRGNYGDSDALYRHIFAYIDENGFELCGPAYEEYLLNEISIQNPKRYLLRISVTVRQK
jgi:DNA-binding transcriptional MerR regulator